MPGIMRHPHGRAAGRSSNYASTAVPSHTSGLADPHICSKIYFRMRRVAVHDAGRVAHPGAARTPLPGVERKIMAHGCGVIVRHTQRSTSSAACALACHPASCRINAAISAGIRQTAARGVRCQVVLAAPSHMCGVMGRDSVARVAVAAKRTVLRAAVTSIACPTGRGAPTLVGLYAGVHTRSATRARAEGYAWPLVVADVSPAA